MSDLTNHTEITERMRRSMPCGLCVTGGKASLNASFWSDSQMPREDMVEAVVVALAAALVIEEGQDIDELMGRVRAKVMDSMSVLKSPEALAKVEEIKAAFTGVHNQSPIEPPERGHPAPFFRTDKPIRGGK